MKKSLRSLGFSAMATLALTQPAWSDESRPSDTTHFHSILHSCNMSFHASGKSIYVGVGYTDIKGEGLLSCYDLAHGTALAIPLRVTARGPGAGLGVTGLVVSGGATGLGISTGPEALLGHYVMLRGNAAVGVGAAVGAGFRLSNGSATIDATVQAESGLGVGVDLLWVNIEASTDRLAENKEHREEPRKEDPKLEPLPVAQNNGPSIHAANVPTSYLNLQKGEPIALVDANGHLLQLIYVNR